MNKSSFIPGGSDNEHTQKKTTTVGASSRDFKQREPQQCLCFHFNSLTKERLTNTNLYIFRHCLANLAASSANPPQYREILAGVFSIFYPLDNYKCGQLKKKKKKKKKPTHSPDFTTQYIHHDHKENQSKKITKTMLKRLNSKLIFLFTKCWLFIFTIYVQSLVPARTSSRTCQPLVSGSSIFSGILVRTMA